MGTVAVFGTVFVDCKGFAQKAYNPQGRNLGHIEFFHGGVARNVAENLAYLGLPVRFVSTVDESALAEEVCSRLQAAGVDMQCVPAVGRGMGMWLAVLGANGELLGSISQMPDLTALGELVQEKGRALLEKTQHVILELDLNAALTLRVLELAAEQGVPVHGIPGNLSVILEKPDILPRLASFICNDVEAGRLLKRELSVLEPEEIAKELRAYADAQGMQSMVITLGARGAVYYDAVRQELGYQPVFKTDVVDSTGAGDAFFSGTVYGLAAGKPLGQAVVCGTQVAAWTIACAENTCPDLAKRKGSSALFRK